MTMPAIGNEQIDTASAPPRALPTRIRRADQILGKRWVVLILRTLLEGPCRFSEIAAAAGMMSERTLSARLSDLEAHGIIQRRVDADCKPVRIDYALTTKGQALEPVIRAIDEWATLWIGE